jgi:hypothetical protein
MSAKRLMVHFLALIAGLVAFVIVAILNSVGSVYLTYAMRLKAGSWAMSDENWPLVVGWDGVGPIFFWGYPAAVGVATCYLFWNGWPRENGRLVLYTFVLALVGPLTYINYHMSDQWLNLWIQAGFNMFVAFVGYVYVQKLRAADPSAADARAIQTLAVLLITPLLIALPLFYTTIFVAVGVNLIDHEQVRQINEKVPLIVAGGAGAVVAFLKHLEQIRSPAAAGATR